MLSMLCFPWAKYALTRTFIEKISKFLTPCSIVFANTSTHGHIVPTERKTRYTCIAIARNPPAVSRKDNVERAASAFLSDCSLLCIAYTAMYTLQQPTRWVQFIIYCSL